MLLNITRTGEEIRSLSKTTAFHICEPNSGLLLLLQASLSPKCVHRLLSDQLL